MSTASFDGPPARILVAEDNPTNSRVARIILQKAGHDVTVVGNGAEALDALRVADYDIVLMDIRMPVMGGLEAAQRIRQMDREKANIPIIAMTANVMPGDIEDIKAHGINDYMPKPFASQDLLRAIAHWRSNASPVERHAAASTPAADSDSARLAGRDILETLAEETSIELLPVLVDGFVDDAKMRVSLMNQALERADVKVIGDEAHALKSSAATYGAEKMSAVSKALEQAAMSGDHERCRTLLAELSEIESETFSTMRSLLHSLG